MVLVREVVSLVTALVFIVCPCLNYSPKESNILLNISVISDTHLDYRLPLGQLLLVKALEDMADSSVPPDAVVVSGDLTNYGDGESVKAFYDIFKKHCDAGQWVVASGNHDIGHVEDVTHEQARQRLIQYNNRYIGSDMKHIYYSMKVKGYTFIVMGDQSDDSWDYPDINADQLSFLDRELAKAALEGKPAFVICHWPLEGVNGQNVIWEDGSMGTENSAHVRAILEKYKNVIYISGHMHAGINGDITKALLGFSCVENRNGVNYINLPTYLLVNRYGIPWGGLGFQMEVYGKKMIIRARNYAASKWYSCYEYTVPFE